MFSFLLNISYSQYPIQTLFKGDSVVILTIKQSENINKVIDKQNVKIEEQNQLIEKQTEKLKQQEVLISTLESQVKLINQQFETISKQLILKDSISNHYRSLSDSVGKENVALMDSIWNWSLGPSLIYSQYPDDSTMYILDLTMYYLTTDDFGIFMPRMSDREYNKYVKHIKEIKENPPSFREFDNSSEFEYINKEKIKRRKVWKYRQKKEQK